MKPTPRPQTTNGVRSGCRRSGKNTISCASRICSIATSPTTCIPTARSSSGDWGLALMAHHYNRIAKKDGGKSDAVWATKGKNDCTNGTCVLDLERGVVDRIWEEPWQTDTCIGSWHYDKEVKYKSPKIVIDMLVDIVSRNGNLLLNFPLPSSGMLDPEELKVLAEITKWMAVNSEAIHATPTASRQ